MFWVFGKYAKMPLRLRLWIWQSYTSQSCSDVQILTYKLRGSGLEISAFDEPVFGCQTITKSTCL